MGSENGGMREEKAEVSVARIFQRIMAPAVMAVAGMEAEKMPSAGVASPFSPASFIARGTSAS
jgi:hypothetical protein